MIILYFMFSAVLFGVCVIVFRLFAALRTIVRHRRGGTARFVLVLCEDKGLCPAVCVDTSADSHVGDGRSRVKLWRLVGCANYQRVL